MSLFRKLSQINKDIEILEEYGDLKSANILHKKFIREAQIIGTNPPIYPESSQNDSPAPKVTPQPQDPNDKRDYNVLLNHLMENYNNGYFDDIYKEYKDKRESYPADEKAYLDKGVQRVLQQRAKENLPNPPGALAVAPKSQTSAPTGPKSWVANTTGLTVSTPGVTPQTIPQATVGQGVVADKPVTNFEYEDTSKNYNPRDPNLENNNLYNSEQLNQDIRNNIISNDSNASATQTTDSIASEPQLTPEQKIEMYYKNTIKNSQEVENLAARKRILPQIYLNLRSGKIEQASNLLNDYTSVLYQADIKFINDIIEGMKPSKFGLQPNSSFVNDALKAFRQISDKELKRLKLKKKIYGFEENDFKPDSFIDTLIMIRNKLNFAK